MEHPGHRHQAGAVQRGIDQLQPGGLAQAGADGAALDGGVQPFLAVVAHVGDHAGCQPIRKGNVLRTLQNVGLLDLVVDHPGGVVGHLAAIGAVGLVAVVLGGVVGGGDHNARVGVVVPGGKGQGGHRHQHAIDPHPDAVGGQHTGGLPGEHVGIDPAVIGDGHQLAAPLGLDPVGQALGGLTHGVNIHAVAACAQHTPQSAGAEFQRDGKPLLDLVLVPGDALQLCRQRRILQLRGPPALVIVHIHLSSPILFWILIWNMQPSII